jgi:hypothetical protein
MSTVVRSPASGYANCLYAESLAAFGEARELVHSGGWLLERRIPHTSYCDGMGSYPLFVCRDWSGLQADFEELADRLVTVTVVADPFGNYTLEKLLRSFDVVRSMKPRYVVDLAHVRSSPPSLHHQKRAERALRRVEVQIHQEGLTFLDEWNELYSHLSSRHSLSGVPAFSREAFRAQLSVPGLVVFRALRRGIPVGMHLWYLKDDVAYSHLIALDPAGYKVGAAFALHAAAIRHFTDTVRWLDLGGGAGLSVPAEDGLAAFKRGWANDQRPSLICGRILNGRVYDELCRGENQSIDYFPAYRAREHATTFGSSASFSSYCPSPGSP